MTCSCYFNSFKTKTILSHTLEIFVFTSYLASLLLLATSPIFPAVWRCSMSLVLPHPRWSHSVCHWNSAVQLHVWYYTSVPRCTQGLSTQSSAVHPCHAASHSTYLHWYADDVQLYLTTHSSVTTTHAHLANYISKSWIRQQTRYTIFVNSLWV